MRLSKPANEHGFRIRKRFFFLPASCRGETRWLESGWVCERTVRAGCSGRQFMEIVNFLAGPCSLNEKYFEEPLKQLVALAPTLAYPAPTPEAPPPIVEEVVDYHSLSDAIDLFRSLSSDPQPHDPQPHEGPRHKLRS